MKKFGSFFGKPVDKNNDEPQLENSQSKDKKITIIPAELTIEYRKNTNILSTDLDQFFIDTIEEVQIIEPIEGESIEQYSIDGFSDPISKQITRFPNENKHSIILFVCDKESLDDKTDYLFNKRKDSYFVVKYGGQKPNLIYVDHVGEEMNVTSIKYKVKHPVIYPHQCLVGCCNDVPMFYFKNKGKIKILFGLKKNK